MIDFSGGYLMNLNQQVFAAPVELSIRCQNRQEWLRADS